MNKFFSKTLLGMIPISLLVLEFQPTIALVPNNVAVIRNSGSTNTIGYRIYVSPSGQVNYVDGKGSGQGTLSKELTNKFFHDLKIAEPLSHLSTGRCIKSASFGTTTTVSFNAENSPDISCPKDTKAKSLYNDVTTIAQALKVGNIPKRLGKPLPVQNF